MVASPQPAERLQSLDLMREQIGDGGRPDDYFPLVRSLIADADQDCRWQALILMGEFIPSHPEAVWEVVCEYGVSEDEDLRDGVATVLLEHLLEHHFAAFFPRVKEQIEAGSPLLRDTLSRCWAFGQAVPRWGEVQVLTKQEEQQPGDAP